MAQKIYRFNRTYRYQYEVKANNLEQARKLVQEKYIGEFARMLSSDWEFVDSESEQSEKKSTKNKKTLDRKTK